MLIDRFVLSQNVNTVIRCCKASLLFVCVMLSACKPLSEYGFMSSLLDRGTLLASGEYTPNNHWEGQWKIVNIWAEWCQPCWQEIPDLNQFYKQNNGYDNNKEREKTEAQQEMIQVLGLNFDQLDAKELAKLKIIMSIEFPVLTQWPEVWEKPDIKGLPATVIIGPNNKVRNVLFGPQTLKSLNDAITQEMENK